LKASHSRMCTGYILFARGKQKKDEGKRKLTQIQRSPFHQQERKVTKSCSQQFAKRKVRGEKGKTDPFL